MNTIIKILVIAIIAILSGCSKEVEDNPDKPEGGPSPVGLYFFCGEDGVTEAHNSTLTVSADEGSLTVDILSYGLESITKTGGSEFIISEKEEFPWPTDPKYYYNTVDNPYYKFYRYREPVTFLFTDNGNSTKPLTATFRIEAKGFNGTYADITIIKDIKRK